MALLQALPRRPRAWARCSPSSRLRRRVPDARNKAAASMYASKAEWSIRKGVTVNGPISNGAPLFHGWNACGNSFLQIAALSLMCRTVWRHRSRSAIRPARPPRVHSGPDAGGKSGHRPRRRSGPVISARVGGYPAVRRAGRPTWSMIR